MSLNPFLLQKQLRENANDLNDFANDLKKWGEEMKRKEESLKGILEPPNKVKIRKSPGSKNKIQSKKPVAKIGSTDYAAWDKFDVDAELEKLEEDADEDSELTDECNDKMYDEAILEKEKGNKFVKQQNWDEAIKSYTKAIDCYSYDPIFYANRALCYLKKKQFAEAEKDCNLSLKLDQTYVKAYQRRASARVGLNNLDYAEQDYLKVLELEPKNQETKKELDNLRQKLNRNKESTTKPVEQRPVSKFTASRNKSVNNVFEAQKIPSSSMPRNTPPPIDDSKPSPNRLPDDIIIVKPINKKPHLRSQKPLRRIKIVEVGDIEPTKIAKLDEAVKSHVIEKKQVEISNSNKFSENIKIEKSDEAIKTHVIEKTQEMTVLDSYKIKNVPDKVNQSTEVTNADMVEKKETILLDNKIYENICTKVEQSAETDKAPVTEKKQFDNKKKVSFTENIHNISESKPFITSSFDDNNEESSEMISEFKKKQKLRNLRNAQSTTAWPRPDQQNTCIKSDDIKIIENKNPKEEKNLINNDKKYDDFDKNYVAPKNSVQFYTAWKNLKSTEEKCRFLRKIEPPEIPKIFRSSLESNVFSNMLEVLAKHFIEDKIPVIKILYYLSQVERFSAITMFMTDNDKSNLWKLFDYIKKTNESTQEEIDGLIRKFEL